MQLALNKGLRHKSQPLNTPLRLSAERLQAQQYRGKKKESKGNPHLHGLWRFPVQATCLCLLQRLRPSHPQRALGLKLDESKASFLRNSTSKEPRELWLCRGCNTAVQMETAACISGSTSRNTSAAASLLWTVASYFFFFVQMNTIYKIK